MQSVLSQTIGLSYATGEYVAFLDTDDWISENLYERYTQAELNRFCQQVQA